MKVGKVDHYDINTIDRKTKFIVEEEFMISRTREQIDAYFKRIKSQIYDQALRRYHDEKQKHPHRKNSKMKLLHFYSDGFENYGASARKYFDNVCNITVGVPIKAKAAGLEHNNNSIERYNQDIEERYKVTRHWGSFESTKKTSKMRQIIHNFVNPHMGLAGKTPSQEAEIKGDFGRNKLLNLIEIVSFLKSYGDDVN